MLETLAEQCGSTQIVVLRGELDHLTAVELAEALDEQLPPPGRGLLIDMADLSYIDSGGLGVLYSALGRLPEQSWVGAVAPSPGVRRILDIGGLTTQHSFRVFEGREQACEEARKAIAEQGEAEL